MGHTDHWMLKLGVLIWSHSVATYSHPQLEGFYRPLPTISIIDMLAFHFPTCEYFQKTRLPAELEKSSWKWRLTVELNNEAKKLLLNLSNSILIKANLEWINLLREAFFFFFSFSQDHYKQSNACWETQSLNSLALWALLMGVATLPRLLYDKLARYLLSH